MSKSLIETLKALASLAESPTNEHEAANAAAILQRELLKHNLSMSEVLTKSEREEQDPLVEQKFDFSRINRKHKRRPATQAPRWKRLLAAAVAECNLCQTVSYKSSVETGTKIRTIHKASFLGRKHNVEAAVWMYETLEMDLVEISEKVERELGSKSGKYWSSWFEGAVCAIHERLKKGLDDFHKESEESRDLVLRNRTEVQRFLEETYPKLRHARRSKVGDYQAYADGRKAGKKMTIKKRGITGGDYGPPSLRRVLRLGM